MQISLSFPSTARLVFSLVALSVSVSIAPSAQAQNDNKSEEQAGPQKVSGIIGEVKRKGKAVSLVILSESGGEPITIPITPRVPFAIEAKGDLGFLQGKQVVSGTGTLTGGNLFVKKWTVHVGLAAKKMRPSVTKSASMTGISNS